MHKSLRKIIKRNHFIPALMLSLLLGAEFIPTHSHALTGPDLGAFVKKDTDCSKFESCKDKQDQEKRKCISDCEENKKLLK